MEIFIQQQKKTVFKDENQLIKNDYFRNCCAGFEIQGKQKCRFKQSFNLKKTERYYWVSIKKYYDHVCMYITLVLSNNDMIYINFMNERLWRWREQEQNDKVKLKLKSHDCFECFICDFLQKYSFFRSKIRFLWILAKYKYQGVQ